MAVEHTEHTEIERRAQHTHAKPSAARRAARALPRGCAAGLLALALLPGHACDSSSNRRPEPKVTVAPTPAPAAIAYDAPSIAVEPSGRLTLSRAEVNAHPAFVLKLGATDESRGEGERKTKVISTDGRVLDTVALPYPGEGTGMRLEIDPAWLEPNSYLIQVATAEPRPLALHRYFLEVTE